MSWALAMFVKPLAAVLFLLFLRACVAGFARFMPDGKIKRILLLPIGRKRRQR